MLYERQMNNAAAQVILKEMVETGFDPHRILEEKDLKQIIEPQNIVGIVDSVLADNPAIVADIKAGKITKAQYLVGQAMKLSKGKADPGIIRELLGNKLGITF